MRHRTVASPVGPLRLAAEGPYLRRLAFTDDVDPADGTAPPDSTAPPGDATQPDGTGALEDAVLAETVRQLEEYFAGTREVFELPVAPRGTDLQRRVWLALRDVPYGTTVTYGELAGRLDLPPGSARAVGAALGANPIVIVLACHRVIGADGGLTGFGGGIVRKETLLALEGSALL